MSVHFGLHNAKPEPQPASDRSTAGQKKEGQGAAGSAHNTELEIHNENAPLQATHPFVGPAWPSPSNSCSSLVQRSVHISTSAVVPQSHHYGQRLQHQHHR